VAAFLAVAAIIWVWQSNRSEAAQNNVQIERLEDFTDRLGAFNRQLVLNRDEFRRGVCELNNQTRTQARLSAERQRDFLNALPTTTPEGAQVLNQFFDIQIAANFSVDCDIYVRTLHLVPLEP
jgi:hypothetical protein